MIAYHQGRVVLTEGAVGVIEIAGFTQLGGIVEHVSLSGVALAGSIDDLERNRAAEALTVCVAGEAGGRTDLA